jgi:Major Facilitator Superfamily
LLIFKGTVLLIPGSQRQAPLGLEKVKPANVTSFDDPATGFSVENNTLPTVINQNQALFVSHGSPENSGSSPYSGDIDVSSPVDPAEKKRTKDGKIILEPQPDDSKNDPLNWNSWRRDAALLSIGFHSLIGGGMTPILAAGFKEVAATYNVTVPRIALTTGLYMMGLGVGCVLTSPTAILYGKRPVYLVCALLFLVASVWCAFSPNYASLVVARVVMGIGVSPCESLPSASIAEIFFLHERAYRIGIYTLLLLSGKNLVPLVAAAIVQSLGWRWIFK